MSDCFDHEADAYDSLLNGADEEPDGYWSGSQYRSMRPTTKTCNKCGAGNLHWQSVALGWRLFEADGKMHTCGQTKSKPGKAKPQGVSIKLG